MAEKRGLLEESKLFQEFRTQVQEMNDFITDKKRLLKVFYCFVILLFYFYNDIVKATENFILWERFYSLGIGPLILWDSGHPLGIENLGDGFQPFMFFYLLAKIIYSYTNESLLKVFNCFVMLLCYFNNDIVKATGNSILWERFYPLGIGPLIPWESDHLTSGIRDILWETGQAIL